MPAAPLRALVGWWHCREKCPLSGSGKLILSCIVVTAYVPSCPLLHTEELLVWRNTLVLAFRWKSNIPGCGDACDLGDRSWR